MPEPMGAVDATWLRMDRADNTADVVALLAFNEAPRFADVRRLIEERLLASPRFRQRPIHGSLLGGDAWEPDPVFSVDRHLVQRSLRGGEAALRETVGTIASEPLDPARPLWRVHLVEGAGTAALVAKLHHCLADGFALVSLLLQLADEPPDVPQPRHAMAAYRRLAPWLEPGALAASALRHPRAALGFGVEGVAMAAALARMTALAPDPPTVLSRPLAGCRRVAWSRGLSLDAVRAGARAHGGTVNDLILAAVAGALRGHLAAVGERVDGLALRALVPVNLRPSPPSIPGTLGNRFGLVFLDLPVGVPAAADRVDAIRTATARMKSRPDAVVSFGVLGALGYLPAVQPWATRFFCRKASLVITNVPGPRTHLHLAGRRIEHAMFWVPHPVTLGVGVSVLSYAGEVRIGVRADVAVMPDPGDLVGRFEEELCALAGDVSPLSWAGPAVATSGTPSP